MSVAIKLETLAIKQTRNINGSHIFRLDESNYLINGEQHSLKEAINILSNNTEVNEEVSSDSSISKTVNYDKLIFILVEPPFRVISVHKINNEEDKQKLVNDAVKKGLLLYYSDVRQRDGKYYAAQPWLIDWASVPNDMGQRHKIAKKNSPPKEQYQTPTKTAESSDTIKCPYCNKKLNSIFGRTNHVKGKHPEKIEEYTKSYG